MNRLDVAGRIKELKEKGEKLKNSKEACTNINHYRRILEAIEFNNKLIEINEQILNQMDAQIFMRHTKIRGA